MGHQQSVAQSYEACSTESYEDACARLILVLRCYVDDEFRIDWRHYAVKDGPTRRHKVAHCRRRGEHDVYLERSKINGIYAARVELS